MNIMRDLYNEIKDENFKNITYGLFNKIYDDNFVSYLNIKYKQCFSIDDFEYQKIVLNESEKFLRKINSKEYNLQLVILKQKLSKLDTYRFYTDEKNGNIDIIRLKKELI